MATQGMNESGDYDYNDNATDHYGVCSYERHGTHFLPQLYSLFFVLGVTGNSLVIWVMLKCVKLRSMTDICLLNLAITDVLLIFSLPFLAHHAKGHRAFGVAMCKVVLGIYYIGFFSGIFFITLMSLDRYLAIVHAVYALKTRTRTFGVISSVVIWIISCLASFPELPSIVAETDFPSLCYVSYRINSKDLRVLSLFKINIIGFLIPFGIMSFCYSMIIKRLLSSQSPQKMAMRLVLVVVLVFFCCWIPYNVATFFKALELLGIYSACETSKAIALALQITETLAYTHCWLNPIIYVFVGQKFRRHFYRLMNRVSCIKRLIKFDPSQASSLSQSTRSGLRSTGM